MKPTKCQNCGQVLDIANGAGYACTPLPDGTFKHILFDPLVIKIKNEKKKPEKTQIFCPSCGKELAEHELFFGRCRCKHPVGIETQPTDRISKIIDKAIDDTINDL